MDRAGLGQQSGGDPVTSSPKPGGRLTHDAPVSWLATYRIMLPADYDMRIIRERVRTRGSALDDRDGLQLKAYLIREAGLDGASVNMYAPFYLWSDAAAMAAFHWKGGGFEGIVRDFGRPEVHTWLPVAAASGSLPIVDARVATTLSSSVGSDLPTAAGALSNLVDRLTGQPGVAWAAAGIDPRTWQSVLFAIGDPTMEAPGDRWQVLHVSAPARRTPH